MHPVLLICISIDTLSPASFIYINIDTVNINNRLLSLYFQNILEKFNPGARQLISAGKAYLKALHGM